MRIAVLMAQTDVSDFALSFTNDGVQVIALLRQARPHWSYANHLVFQGDFPANINDYDGFVITGSVASANDTDPWIVQLKEMVREIDAAKRPLFGICFGHQLIARALGGEVIRNPNGWRFGVAQSAVKQRQDWMTPSHPALPQFAAHSEQVSHLPEGATSFASATGTPIAGFTKGRHIATTQYHPEMSYRFFNELIEELADKLPPEAIAQAKAQKNRETRSDLMAKWMVQFFEQAQA